MAHRKRKSSIPAVIPPGTVVEIVSADEETPAWKDDIGTRCTTGYYNQQDGLGLIYLLDEDGYYFDTIDRDLLLKYFQIVRLSRNKDYFGEKPGASLPYYMGIELVFAAPVEDATYPYEAWFLRYAIKASNVAAVRREAERIGAGDSWGKRGRDQDFLEYIGIRDLFLVIGPMSHGAMLGHTASRRYKTAKDAESLLSGEPEFTIHTSNDKAVGGYYLADLIYHCGPPTPYAWRYAIRVTAAVRSARRTGAAARATELATCRKWQCKHIIPFGSKDSIRFVGIGDIRPILRPFRLGSWLQGGVGLKPYRRLYDIRRLVARPEKIEDFPYDLLT